MASRDIKITNGIGYGEQNLKNIKRNITLIKEDTLKVIGFCGELKYYNLVTRFCNIKCSIYKSDYGITVSYTEDGKTTSRTVYVSSSKVNNTIIKLNDNLIQCKRALIDIEDFYDKAQKSLIIAIEAFRKEDAKRAKEIEDRLNQIKNIKLSDEYKDAFKNINEDDVAAVYSFDVSEITGDEKTFIEDQIKKIKESDYMCDVIVGKDVNGNIVFVKTRLIDPKQLETIITNKFKSDVGDRKDFKIDHLADAFGDSIIMDGNILTRKENDILKLEDGIIFKSNSWMYDGSSTGPFDVGKSNISYFTMFGIPVGTSGGITAGEVELADGLLSGNIKLANGSIGITKEEGYDEGVNEVNYNIGGSISLISGEAGLDSDPIFNFESDTNSSQFGGNLKVSADLGASVGVNFGYETDEMGEVDSIKVGANLKFLLGIEGEINIPLGPFKGIFN